MREERATSALRLRLLAVVLALALTWYAINPAPGPARRVRRDDESPDEERREVGSPREANYEQGRVGAELTESATNLFSHAAVSDADDDLEWPEVIDVN